jgi:ATP-dependent helicase HrpA
VLIKADFAADIERCMLIDQQPLRDRLRSMRRGLGKRQIDEHAVGKLKNDIQRSIDRRQTRLAALPQPSFASDLPIVQHREQIARAISEHQVVIVCGETGSGKTTQLPKVCLEMGRGAAGMIGHTQPRRIAARSVAARIASELNTTLGQQVAYKVRFSDKVKDSANLKIMTDGVLLAETQSDRDLLRYDTIIIDEAHERSLNIDFLLGYLKQLLPRRPELKVIVTSATIDPQRFSRHFDEAPIIEVSGRMYPVEVRYRPVQAEEDDEEDPTILEAIIEAVAEIEAIDGRGDILIFLSGEREIRETAEALQKSDSNAAVLPLYARQALEDQQRVFEPHVRGGRRIVLATNVAETSLTVPGIRYVIDPGYARISRYSANARVQRLPIERISQASADQRKGRCGRIEAGVCFRLYSEDDYRDRPRFTDPEILRANLASVILQMKALQLGDIDRFPFLESPRLGMIREGYQTLHELGAIDDHGRLAAIGRELARLPVDPRLGRMILAAREEDCVREVLIIASALATQDPRLRPLDQPQPADLAHQQFADERSDFMSYLALWSFYHQRSGELSSNQLRKLCKRTFLSIVRLREWHDVHRQLEALVTRAGMKLNDRSAAYESIHRALLSGLLANVGLKHHEHEYLGVRDRKFSIFPGSFLFKKEPKWIMAAELVETTRLYARTVARIQPEWIERLAEHLLKRTYTAPHWNATSAHVEAYERVTLHGLVIVPKRRVHFGRIDPVLAREIFLQNALVEGRFRTNAECVRHNQVLIEEVRDVEAKTRRRDVMVNQQAIFDFYDKRIPQEIYNGPLFERWRRKAERHEPRLLFLSSADLMDPNARRADPAEFPDSLIASGASLPLTYRLEPGDACDGVTLTVPAEALSMVHEDRTEWLVPGLLREKIIALIKSLPKELRRNFVPAPEFAEACMKSMCFGAGSLLDQISAALTRISDIQIRPGAWNLTNLPDHLRMNFNVIDAEGATLAKGRDLTAIKQQVHRLAPNQGSAAAESGFERNFINTWDFGDLPERIELQRGGITMFVYPAIVDAGGSVSLKAMDSLDAALHASRAGIRRLFVLAVQEELAAHVEYLPGIEELGANFDPLGRAEDLKLQLIELAADRAFLAVRPQIRQQTEFERRLRSGWNDLWPAVTEVSDLVKRIVAAHHEVDVQLISNDNPFLAAVMSDIRAQLEHLIPHGFLLSIPFEWLSHYPRYLNGIQIRLRKLSNAGIARDEQCAQQIAAYWQRYEQRLARHRVHGIYDPALEQFRWMIEELRVSLFAQGLGTLLPVSAKRMESQWSRVAP